MNLSELDGMSVIVRADAGETPSMTQMRAWTFLNALSNSMSEVEAMALARKRVCEQYLGCRYGEASDAAEWPAKDPRARAHSGARGGGAKHDHHHNNNKNNHRRKHAVQ